jgi:ribosomal protein S18 acetylase RimI-like enzyme
MSAPHAHRRPARPAAAAAPVPTAPAPGAPAVRVRIATRADLDALLALEQRVFATDRLSRRSLHHLLASPAAAILVAEDHPGHLAGTAIVLFRPRSAVARLYSIAVAPHMGGRGVGVMLIAAAEAAAAARDCRSLRLEVHVTNHAAIARYRKSGYREFGRVSGYYEDGGDALRFEKRLVPDLPALRNAPPYVHQTTDFTCGPACILMALAWADPKRFQPTPARELELWRQATTIFPCSNAGPGGCEPYGMAVTLARHGLKPEIYVSRPPPYFLESVKSTDARRVMELTQVGFQNEVRALAIPSHLTPVNESALMRAFDAGSVAIILVSGYHMVARGKPHWIFAFGRDGRHVLMHDPAALRDDRGMALAAETYAVPWSELERVADLRPAQGRPAHASSARSSQAHGGHAPLSAAIIIRKGSS